MKKMNAKELNEQYRDCPAQEQEYEIEGRKYIVVSHYVGEKRTPYPSRNRQARQSIRNKDIRRSAAAYRCRQ